MGGNSGRPPRPFPTIRRSSAATITPPPRKGLPNTRSKSLEILDEPPELMESLTEKQQKRLSRSYDSNMDVTGIESCSSSKPNETDYPIKAHSCDELDEGRRDSTLSISSEKNGSMVSLPSTNSSSVSSKQRKKNFMDKCVNKVRLFIKK